MRSPVRTAVALLALAATASGLWLQIERSGRSAIAGGAVRSSVLVVVRLPAGPLLAVVAAGGGTAGSAVAIAPSTTLTIPGQGQGSAADAAMLPGPPAVAAISNLLGVWIPHYAFTNGSHLAARVDREGGISLFGRRLSGSGVLAALAAPGRLATWREVMRALLWGADPWRPGDFVEADDGALVGRVLSSAGSVQVMPLPTERIGGGLLQIDDAAATSVLRAFGPRPSDPVPVVVLNGSGIPGVGQHAAELLIPAGFRIVSSGNASSFDHRDTLVVASSGDDEGLAERAQRALGAGSVSVAGVPSGLAAVTIVLGKDFRPE